MSESQDKTIYWHLPGFSVFFYLNQVIIHMLNDYPDMFRDGYKVGSVYGTFPGAIWNGGRAVFVIWKRSLRHTMIWMFLSGLHGPIRS